MTSGSEDIPRPPSTGNRLARRIVPACIAIIPGVLIAAFLGLLLVWRDRAASLAVSLAAMSLALAGAQQLVLGFAARRQAAQRRAYEQLSGTLTAIRAGEAPIEELGKIAEPATALAAQVADLFRDIRTLNAELAEHQREMRQRVARRTEALERTINSLRLQAIRDPLTGLYNRRSMEDHLGKLIEQARQSGSDLCLLMLDLDNFKALNDSLGHAAGDQTLRAVGQIIRSSIREQDAAFRCGGDEFLIAMPDSPLAGAKALGRRIEVLVDTLGKSLKTARPVGMSVGTMALSERPRATMTQLLEEADRLLYECKEARKTRPANRDPRGGPLAA